MRTIFLVTLNMLFVGTSAFATTSKTGTNPCGNDFALIGKESVKAARVTSGGFDEIAEIALWAEGVQKLQKRLQGALWTSTSTDRLRAIRESRKAAEISDKLEKELTNVLKKIDESPTKEDIYRVMSLGNERTVGTALRLGLHTGGYSNQLDYLPVRLEKAVAKRCTTPATHQCKAATFEYLVGSDRRAVDTKDLAQKLGLGPSENFQILDSTRLSKADAEVVATYLKGVDEIKIDGSNGLVVQHESQAPAPAALLKYFDQLQVSLGAIDREAKIEGIEVIHVLKGQARTPYTHFDNGPAIQILTTFEGSRTWMQGADGRFFQIPELGDSALFYTTQTANPTAHLSPADFETERVLIRIFVSSAKFTAQRK